MLDDVDPWKNTDDEKGPAIRPHIQLKLDKLTKMNRLLLSFCYFFIVSNLFGQEALQTQKDSYTRYELLEPESNAFRIVYDVTATTPGKNVYYNTLRKGSEHIVSAVWDRMSGQALKWEIVDGSHAMKNGHPRANIEGHYLKVYLARPVPKDGGARIRIDKTYKDPLSYLEDGDRIVFERTLGIKRNALVLPQGFEVISCNYPSQVEMEDDGRLKLSFMNRGSSAVPYKVVAQRLKSSTSETRSVDDPHPWPDYQTQPQGRDKSKARIDYSLNERAYQNRDIVYFLQQPETHSFRLYHDYTESRIGRDKYLNVVRAGSKASNPSAFVLDTGEELKVETLIGEEIAKRGIDIGGEVKPNTEVVVIWYPKVQEGQSIRLRIWETYTDPNRYLLHNDELIWDRSFGRNRNKMVLPEGWWLTTSSIPAMITHSDEGQPELYFVNDRPDNIDVFIRARRR